MLYGEKYALIYVKKYDQDDFIQHFKIILKGGSCSLRYIHFYLILWQNKIL